MNVDLCMNLVSCTWFRDIKTCEVIVINWLSLTCCNLLLYFFSSFWYPAKGARTHETPAVE